MEFLDEASRFSKLESFEVKSDFHIHSNFSGDGEHSIIELVELLKKEDIKRAAIADHDSIEGVELAVKAASSYSIEIIPAVELTTIYNNQFIHILGYDIPSNPDQNCRLLKELEKISQKRYDNIPLILNKMRTVGIKIEEEDLYLKMNGRAPMITAYSVVALNNKLNDDLEIFKPYRKGGPRSLNAAINFTIDYLIQDKQLYVEEYNPLIQEGVEAISISGGIPVIAHPGIWFEDEHIPVLKKLIDRGLQGLEVYTPYHKPEQVNYFKQLAGDYGLISTHGSDFHGFHVKPYNRIGKFGLAK